MLLVTTAVVFVSGLFVWKSDLAAPIRLRISESLHASEDEQKRAGFYFTRNALAVAAAHPLGVGVGNTEKFTEPFNGFAVGAHNTFVMVMSDLGWVPFAAFIFVQMAIFGRLVLMALRGGQALGLSARMLCSSYLCLLVAGMFQDLLYYMPMWLVPALATTALFTKSVDPSSEAPLISADAQPPGPGAHPGRSTGRDTALPESARPAPGG